MIKKIMTKAVYLLSLVFDHTDRKVKAIYDEPIEKIEKVNKTIISVNKMLNRSDATYHIGRAMGIIIKE